MAGRWLMGSARVSASQAWFSLFTESALALSRQQPILEWLDGLGSSWLAWADARIGLWSLRSRRPIALQDEVGVVRLRSASQAALRRTELGINPVPTSSEAE